MDFPDSIKKTQGPQGIYLGSVVGNFKGDLNMALGSQIVDLVGLDLFQQTVQITGIGDIPVVKEKFVFIFFVIYNMVNPASIERTAAPYNSMDFVALSQQ